MKHIDEQGGVEKLLYTNEELAMALGISSRALAYRAARGESMPRRVMFGRAVRYRKKDIELWLDSLQECEEDRQGRIAEG